MPESVKTVNATEFRKNMSAYMDAAKVAPLFIKRTRDEEVLLSTELLSLFLPKEIEVIVEGEKGDYVVTCEKSVDNCLVGGGATIEEAKRDFAESLFEFATDIFANPERYVNAPNLRPSLPLFLAAYRMGSIDRVSEALVCRNGVS